MTSSTLPPHLLQRLIDAERLRLAGQWAMADGIFCEVLDMQPDCAPAQHGLALIALATHQLPLAIDLLVKAIAMRPDVAAYHRDLGELCRRVGRIDDAIRATEQALRITPHDASAYYNLGLALAEAGRLNETAQAFATAVQYDPSHHYAMANLGILYQRQGDRARALHCYQALEGHSAGLAAQLGFAFSATVADINPPSLQMRDTGSIRGRGVFALHTYEAGELVEAAAVVLLNGAFETYPVELKTYVFNWAALCEVGHAHAVVLGYGSLYNHDNPANMHYEADPANMAMRFIAARNIAAGEELTVNYSGAGGRASSDNNDWFERVHKKSA